MRKLKLFLSLLMLMAFSVGNVWATLPSSPTWEAQALADIADGSTIIIISNSSSATNVALPAAGAGSSNPPKKACTVTTNAGVTTITPPNGTTLQDLAWTVSKQASSWKFYVEGSSTNCLYLTGTSSNTALRVGEGSSNNEFVMGDLGKLLKVTTAARFVGPYDNNGTDWRTYNTENATNYKGAQLTFYVLKAAASCSNTVTITKGAETNGTYTLSATEICGDGEGEDVTISDITPASGYAFDEITTSASGTVDNENKKVTSITAATTITVLFKELQKYTVSFNTGAGNPAVSPITEATAGAGITLPAGPTPACSADGWTFAGWAAAAVASETTSAPTLLSGKYNPTDNVTLYAVYKRTEEGGVADNSVTETFENQTAGSTYNSTQNYEAANSNANIAWTMYYGTVSTNDKITGANSAHMRWYSSATTNYGYIQNTTPISGLQKISFNARVSNTAVKMSVWYSTDGENWTLIDENLTFDAQNTATPFSSTINGAVGTDYYIRIGVGDGGTAPSSGNYKLIVDDVKFEFKAGASTTYYLSAPSCCEKHNVNVALGIQYGKVEADLTSACEGTVVTLTAMPDTHCAFVAWDVKQGETPVAVSDNKFTMPAGDVTVSATFAEIKNAVTFAAPAGGTLSIMNGEDAVATGAQIVEGTALTVTATPDAENHYIGGTIKVVKISDESDVTASVLDGSTLTMPNYAITVSATFTPTYAINIVAEGGSIALEYTKDGAADGYALAGTEIMATATADDAHVFTSLALSENVTIKDIDANVAMFTMPAEAVTITATFDAKSTPTISVSTDAIAFDPVDYNGELTAQTFKVSGVALVAGKLTITSNNEAFSVSPAEIDVDGALDETEITVTPKTTACGTFNATITISSDNAAAKEVSVSLTVNKLASNLAWSAAEATVTIDADDNVFPTLTNPRNLPVVYSSLYDEVASIDENGAVTLKKAGETMIIVNFAGNDTVTALAEDALYYTLTVQQKYTVEWYINGAKKGEQTALTGVALENIPDATSIENGAIAGKVFRGWATAAIDGEVDEAPALLNPTVMPGADTKYYAVYAVETPGEAANHDVFAATMTSTVTDGYSISAQADSKSGYYQDGSGTDRYVQVMVSNTATQIIASEPSAITVTAKLGGGTAKDPLDNNVYAQFLDAEGNVLGDAVLVTNKIDVNTGKDYVVSMPVANYANVRGVRISHVKESGYNVRYYAISMAYTTSAASTYSKYATSGPRLLAEPTISLAAGTYTTAQNVELTAEEGDIYYTLDGTEPTSESDKYTAPIEFNKYGEYTLKAIAIDGENKSNVVSVEYSMKVPFATVAELISYVETNSLTSLTNVTVTGIISQIDNFTSNAITYWISDNGQTNAFEVYKGKGLNGADFEAITDLTVGDQVTVNGNYTYYEPAEGDPIHEFASFSSKIVERTAAEVTSVVISGTATKTEYFYNDDFSFAGLVATANYNTGYTKVFTEEANVWAADPAQVTATGNVNVTATYGGKTSEAKVVAVTKKLRQLDFADLYWSSYDRENILLGYSETPAVRSVINKYNLPVTYRSGNGSVMSVNAETGVITAKAPGYASMFVEFAGNEEYAAHDASYPVAVFGYDHIELSGEATKTAYENGDLFEFAGLTATAVYTLSEQDPKQVNVTDMATWNASPEYVTADGNIAVTATWQEKTNEPVNVAVTVNKHKVTITTPENGTLVVKNGEEAIASGDEFAKGTVLTVEATPASADYKAGVITVTGATLEGNTITVGTTDFTVSAVFAEKAEAGIEWSNTYGEIQLQGTEIVDSDLPSLTNPYELTITYSSDNTDVAEIDPATGVITPKAEGYTTISANFAGSNDYKAAEVSYELTVEVVAQPEFYVIGSFNGWSEYVPVYDTWYRLENLTSGNHQLKVTTTPNWSEAYGYDALTVKHAGLSKDDDGNICFTIPNESFVDIDFEKDEEGVKTFTVTGGYVKPTFTVVGVEALVGYNWDAGLNAFENEMAEDPSTGNYELEKEDVMLAAGDYEYQVAMNHNWRGVDNSKLTITESGIYTVTFTFDPSTGATSAVADLQEAIVVIPTVAVKGSWNEWAASTTLTPAENKETASVTIELAAGSYEFGMEINSNWTANGSAFTRDANSKAVSGSTGNMTIVADVVGEYTFTWTFDGNLLSIAYPELPEPEYYIAGDFTDWGTNKVKMTEDNSALVATVSISSTDEQAFKVLRVQGPYETWYGLENYAKMSSEDCTDWTIGGGESNIGLEPTKAGEYTFVFVPAELKLTVNMPAKGSGTALDNTEADTKAVKTMENGVLIIRRGDKTYNGQGQLLR